MGNVIYHSFQPKPKPTSVVRRSHVERIITHIHNVVELGEACPDNVTVQLNHLGVRITSEVFPASYDTTRVMRLLSEHLMEGPAISLLVSLTPDVSPTALRYLSGLDVMLHQNFPKTECFKTATEKEVQYNFLTSDGVIARLEYRLL